jgi:hypothetical protein
MDEEVDQRIAACKRGERCMATDCESHTCKVCVQMNEPTPNDEGRLLTAAQVAAILGWPVNKVHHNSRTMLKSFAIRFPGQKLVKAYSREGLEKWLKSLNVGMPEHAGDRTRD